MAVRGKILGGGVSGTVGLFEMSYRSRTFKNLPALFVSTNSPIFRADPDGVQALVFTPYCTETLPISTAVTLTEFRCFSRAGVWISKHFGNADTRSTQIHQNKKIRISPGRGNIVGILTILPLSCLF